MKRQSSKQSGFTLVEIAIVLVIVGLLLGGVLKGQELITSSKAKALDNDKTGLTAAFINYSDRYKALAGDDQNVVSRFTANQCGGIACVPGDGNGVLAGTANAFTAAQTAALIAGNTFENLKAWQHLRAAGLIGAGEQHPVPALVGLSSSSNPRNANGTRIGVQATGYFGQIQASQAQVFAELERIPANVAMALDSMVDDGFVNLGSYRGVENGVAATGGTTPAPGTPSNTVPGASYANGATATAVNATPANEANFSLRVALY